VTAVFILNPPIRKGEHHDLQQPSFPNPFDEPTSSIRLFEPLKERLMNNFFKAIGQSSRGFLRDEEGAQVIEYALIIAVVSIALIVLLKGLTGTGGGFTTFITHVTNCLTGTSCP